MRLRTEHFSHFIEGRDDVKLLMHILRLKKEKARLKRKIESNPIGKPKPLAEKDALKILQYRLYIQDTISALEKMGAAYVFDASETAAIQFQENIPTIYRLYFYIGGY